MRRTVTIAAVSLAGLGFIAPPVALAADEAAPCLGEATSANAVSTQGQGVRELAVTEGQSGAIRVIVPTLAQTEECP